MIKNYRTNVLCMDISKCTEVSSFQVWNRGIPLPVSSVSDSVCINRDVYHSLLIALAPSKIANIITT